MTHSRVLVVDDERSIRISLRAFIEMSGHEVALASTAADALALLNEDSFDVVISDINLPRKTGTALLGDIRKIHPDLPVIMTTGEPEVDTAAEAVRKGAFDYLFKPISRDTITRTVAAAIEKKALLDRNRRLERENLAHREQLEARVREKTQEVWSERDEIPIRKRIYVDGTRPASPRSLSAQPWASGPISSCDCWCQGIAPRIRGQLE